MVRAPEFLMAAWALGAVALVSSAGGCGSKSNGNDLALGLGAGPGEDASASGEDGSSSGAWSSGSSGSSSGPTFVTSGRATRRPPARAAGCNATSRRARRP